MSCTCSQDRFKCELDEAQRQMETEKEAALSTQQEIAKTTAEELDHTKKVCNVSEACYGLCTVFCIAGYMLAGVNYFFAAGPVS